MNNSARPINELTGIKKPSSVLIRGASHKEIAIQNGFIPSNWSDEQYVAWGKGERGYSTYELWEQLPGNEGKPFDPDFLDFLGFTAAIQEQAILDAIAAEALLVTAAKAAAESAAESAAGSASEAGGYADDAFASAEDAADALAAMEDLVLTFEKASASEIWVATNDAKYITPLALKAASAFVATDAGEIAANTWTPNMNLGMNRGPLTLDANKTIAAPSNMKDGVTYIWKFKQDATGSRTVTFNAIFDFGDGVNTVTAGANKVSRVVGTYDATENKIMATMHKAA